MHADSHNQEHQPIARNALIVVNILRILAIPETDTRKTRRLAALSREAAELRALVEAGAKPGQLRERALAGIAMAEASIREQTQKAERADTRPAWRSVAAAALWPLQIGRRPRPATGTDLDENVLLRQRSEGALNTLAGLRAELAPAHYGLSASAPRNAKPLPQNAAEPHLAGGEAR